MNPYHGYNQHTQHGRKPYAFPLQLSAEEEHRRSVRRERNKLAAAKCRQRRVDQTNQLTAVSTQ